MATLTVVVQGLALWLDRGSYWEVLFPRARHQSRQHLPRMTVEVNNVLRDGIPLVGQTVDLLHLADGDADEIKKDWRLKMRATKHAPVKDYDVAKTGLVVASILLPRLKLKQVSDKLTGPVEHDDDEVDLDFGTLWRCPLNPPGATLIHRDRTTAVIADKVALGDGSTDAKVFIRNFTEAEHNGDVKPTEEGESLHDVQDLFFLCGLKRRSPKYTGDTLIKPPPPENDAEAEAKATSPVAIVTYPYKLCPQGDGG